MGLGEGLLLRLKQVIATRAEGSYCPLDAAQISQGLNPVDEPVDEATDEPMDEPMSHELLIVQHCGESIVTYGQYAAPSGVLK